MKLPSKSAESQRRENVDQEDILTRQEAYCPAPGAEEQPPNFARAQRVAPDDSRNQERLLPLGVPYDSYDECQGDDENSSEPIELARQSDDRFSAAIFEDIRQSYVQMEHLHSMVSCTIIFA